MVVDLLTMSMAGLVLSSRIHNPKKQEGLTVSYSLHKSNRERKIEATKEKNG